MHRMRIQNNRFQQTKRKKIRFPSDEELILRNKSIYSIIANYIIVFRLINWRVPLENQNLVRSYCIGVYLPKISQVLTQLNVSNKKISSALTLCRKLMHKLTMNPEINSSWATACWVDQYRRITCKDFVTLSDPFEEMSLLRIRVRARNIAVTRESKREGNIQYTEQLDRFFEDMPKSAGTTRTIIFWLYAASQFTSVPVVMTAGSYFDIEYLQLSWNPIPMLGIAGASLITYFAYRTVKELIHFDFTKNQFTLDKMSEECQAALFKEISDYLYPTQFQTEKYDQDQDDSSEDSEPDSKFIPPSTNLKDLDTDIISPPLPALPNTGLPKEEKYAEEEKPRKNPKRKTARSSNFDNQQAAHSPTFEHSLLTPPLNLVWETKTYGTIEYWFGHPETYRLWTLLPQLREYCEKNFVHFPTKKLKEENDSKEVDHYKLTAEIGRLVSDTDRSGFVWVPAGIKLKTFSKYYKNSRMNFLLFQGKPVYAPPGYQNAQVHIGQNITRQSHGSNEEQALYQRLA